MAEVISVSALNQYVKTLLDANDILFDLALRGEIANFVQNARSGHCYFSLRDAAASVKAVMFRSDARRLGFRPEDLRLVVKAVVGEDASDEAMGQLGRITSLKDLPSATTMKAWIKAAIAARAMVAAQPLLV